MQLDLQSKQNLCNQLFQQCETREVYSALFPCVILNLKSTTVTTGISLKGLLVPASMIVLPSQGAPKNEANPGYVTALFSVGASTAFSLSLVEHS